MSEIKFFNAPHPLGTFTATTSSAPTYITTEFISTAQMSPRAAEAYPGPSNLKLCKDCVFAVRDILDFGGWKNAMCAFHRDPVDGRPMYKCETERSSGAPVLYPCRLEANNWEPREKAARLAWALEGKPLTGGAK